MHKFYPADKGRFSACMHEIQAVKVYHFCGNFIIFSVFLAWCKLIIKLPTTPKYLIEYQSPHDPLWSPTSY